MIQDNIENIVALVGVLLVAFGCFLIYGAGVSLIVSGSLILFVAIIPVIINAFKPQP